MGRPGHYEVHGSEVVHDASTIQARCGATSHAEQPTQRQILLRLFVHFHSDKLILLLYGYDKGDGDSPHQQNQQIQKARRRLAHWKAAEAKRAKGGTQEAVGHQRMYS